MRILLGIVFHSGDRQFKPLPTATGHQLGMQVPMAQLVCENVQLLGCRRWPRPFDLSLGIGDRNATIRPVRNDVWPVEANLGQQTPAQLLDCSAWHHRMIVLDHRGKTEASPIPPPQALALVQISHGVRGVKPRLEPKRMRRREPTSTRQRSDCLRYGPLAQDSPRGWDRHPSPPCRSPSWGGQASDGGSEGMDGRDLPQPKKRRTPPARHACPLSSG